MRVLAGLCGVLFMAVGTALLILLFVASLPNENGPDNSPLALLAVGLLALAFLLASGTSLDYASGPTPRKERRAILSGAVAVVPTLLWIVIWVAQSSA